MSAQLDLFKSSPGRLGQQPAAAIDPLLGRMPSSADRTGYQQFDGAKARAIILDLCRKSGGWVGARVIYRVVRMHPSDLSHLCTGLELAGEIESCPLYYASGDPRDKDYRGFQFGYRLTKQENL